MASSSNATQPRSLRRDHTYNRPQGRVRRCSGEICKKSYAVEAPMEMLSHNEERNHIVGYQGMVLSALSPLVLKLGYFCVHFGRDHTMKDDISQWKRAN